MAGTVAPATAADMPSAVAGAGQQRLSASLANSFRVGVVADRLLLHVTPGAVSHSSNPELFGLCLSLARGIDYAVANNEVPSKAQDLPNLLKQVCLRKNDPLLQAAIMVLMISVKNACRIGWFSSKDSQELLTLTNEIGNSFCSPEDINTAPIDSLPIISTVFSKFYPLVKMGHILASLEVKPGYGAYVIDFHIAKNAAHSPQDKIKLFVAEKDNIDTSACIISPLQVNFLLNGKGVERRTNVAMDPGPQLPTDVTRMLKYGTNLLQAVGQFNGHYIIAIAFMSVAPLPDTSLLLDYVHSSVSVADPDSDVIEGPSRVSLNCPISCTRIRTPVKGFSCNHLQCFDFSNYVNINSRRPSWRCPHCNQSVCYSDIRVDQNMVKVLKEVGDNVADVIISADGSWKAVLETDDSEDHTQKEVVDCQKDVPQLQEPSSIVDLTEDDRMEVVGAGDIEDRKPSHATLQSQPVTTNLTTPSQLNIANAVDQNVASEPNDSFWSDIYFNIVSGTSNSGTALQFVNGTLGSTPANSTTASVITDTISPVHNHAVGRHGDNNFSSAMQNQFLASDNMHSQQVQLMNAAANAAINNEYGRIRQIVRNVNRTPLAVQALPASPQILVQQRPRTNLSTVIPNGSSLTSHTAPPMAPAATGINMASNHMSRHQQAPRPHNNPHQGSSSLQHPSSAQNRDHLGRPFNSGQSVRAVGTPAMNQIPGALGGSSGLQMPQSRSQSTSTGRPSSVHLWNQTQQGVGRAGFLNNQHGRFAIATQRPVPPRQPPSVPVQIPTSRGGTSYSSTDATRTPPAMAQRGNVGDLQVNSATGAAVDSSSEQNWQPTGRMRGSLSSQAVSAYKDLIIQPTQPVQTPQPPTNSTPSPRDVSPQLEAFLSKSSNFYNPQAPQNSAMTQPATTSGSSGILP